MGFYRALINYDFILLHSFLFLAGFDFFLREAVTKKLLSVEALSAETTASIGFGVMFFSAVRSCENPLSAVREMKMARQHLFILLTLYR